MTAEEIIEKAKFLVEEKYHGDRWREFVQSVLDDMTQVAKLLKTKSGIPANLTNGTCEITVSEDADLVLAHEFLAAYFTPTGGTKKRLRRLPAHDDVSRGWKYLSDTLVLQEIGDIDGTAAFDYYQRLSLTKTTESGSTFYALNLPADYHELVVAGICIKAMKKEEDPARKAEFQAEYDRGKAEMFRTRTLQMEPWMRHLSQPAAGQ